ncbi:NAD(P)/FAD-dependent oxidoreductase [Flavobacterium sp.]|uniref:NAD(P)/FAD-dependent oxidoreductase n=1 Tax=Flavobacterium sp. TaxID=239 RepID=UPI003BEC2075
MGELDIIIIGGGLAGLTAGIHLSKKELRVTLIEKNEFPKHKVCGEYISNEVIPYLEWLDLKIDDLNPTNINKLQFSSVKGTLINTKLPLGGFGISRYELDNYLYKKALSNGCKIIKDEVESIAFEKEKFTIITSHDTILSSKIVIGAFGKRSNIDLNLNRKFIQHKSPWLAVKAHYSGNFPNDLVGLHNFEGGYCGISKIENDKINICYLTKNSSFKEYKSISDFQNLVVKQNPHLNIIFEHSELIFDKPLTIGQVSFSPKKAVENHILMIGDTAGLIHPLCGNGMAMAIHSAKIVSELIIDYNNNDIKTRVDLEKKYQKKWKINFYWRLKVGRLLATVLLNTKISDLFLKLVTVFPFLLVMIIKKTHGKPILTEN